ncbi:GAF domain-containing protein [Chitinilyticum piscinae]|uniref:GAF domain-containing protein n=1 Tax=Chitinilyticum piscinae TaxID=2866724 RepID=A0A8J7K2U7_9NEIS|nr:GAF domain-containing protein [Chitinilyticum piscinae]MBE9611006.1 GAF domain-containing protein [Chitinilyticum piscinae]
MQAPCLPDDEAERIANLRSLLILDTPPEQRFDNLTRVAAGFFRVPIAVVSLVDAERQWFKSTCGLDARETGRDVSFCGHAILDSGVMVVEDARSDPRFADNPLVTGGPMIRFYAGAPLKSSQGHNLGTLCLISPEPRQMDAVEIQMLQDLARLVVVELERPAE